MAENSDRHEINSDINLANFAEYLQGKDKANPFTRFVLLNCQTFGRYQENTAASLVSKLHVDIRKGSLISPVYSKVSEHTFEDNFRDAKTQRNDRVSIRCWRLARMDGRITE